MYTCMCRCMRNVRVHVRVHVYAHVHAYAHAHVHTCMQLHRRKEVVPARKRAFARAKVAF